MDSYLISLYDDSRTENGMPTHSTSGSHCLDLFYKMGGARGNAQALEKNLVYSFIESPEITLKLLFHLRNIRGGMGERQTFRHLIRALAGFAPSVLAKNLALIPKYGRWDDLFALFGTSLEQDCIRLIVEALYTGDALCAKWMPREGKRGFKEYAMPIISYLGIRKSSWRKMLSHRTNVVENAMCARDWENINFEHVPSVAMNRYRKAFERNASRTYEQYLAEVSAGEKKINAGALFPHSLVQAYLKNGAVYVNGADKSVEEQWKALPNYVQDGLRFLPVVDVSGSMSDNSDLPLLVAVSLGIYLAERNTSIFRDAFITFSRKPTLQYLLGSLYDRVSDLNEASWDMNTDIARVFTTILERAVDTGASDDDMPTHVIILSDMQFDDCIEGVGALDMIRRKYALAGYAVPQVVFWNLRSSNGVPVKVHSSGTALLSGFSPSAMKAVLGGNLDPYNTMMASLAPYEVVV